MQPDYEGPPKVPIELRRATFDFNPEEYSPRRATPVHIEVENEMEECLDYIEAEEYESQNAMPVRVEVEEEMNEVLDYIDAEMYGPSYAESVEAEIEEEMQEVMDAVEAETRIRRRRNMGYHRRRPATSSRINV